MADKPINMQAWEVQALLDGRKTQTCRVLEVRETERPRSLRDWSINGVRIGPLAYETGDRLWVREGIVKTPAGLAYLADGEEHYGAGGRLQTTPSSHMPRWASRLTLIVTNARVRRVQEISVTDVLAEGVLPPHSKAIEAYRNLWLSLYGPDAWDRNDWVVVCTHTVHQKNIDALGVE